MGPLLLFTIFPSERVRPRRSTLAEMSVTCMFDKDRWYKSRRKQTFDHIDIENK